MEGLLADGAPAGAALMLVRVFTAVRFTPFLGGKPVPVLVGLGLSAGLVLLLIPAKIHLLPGAWEVVDWSLQALREVGIGLVYGLFARILFSVLESAGSLFRVCIGDPRSSENGVMGGSSVDALFVFLGLGAFMLVGGHRAMISALAASFDLLPPWGAEPGPILTALPDKLAAAFAGAFGWAVAIALPVLVAKMAAEVISGIIERATSRTDAGGVADMFRAATVQIALIGALGAGVRLAVAFLEEGMRNLPGSI